MALDIHEICDCQRISERSECGRSWQSGLSRSLIFCIKSLGSLPLWGLRFFRKTFGGGGVFPLLVARVSGL